MGWWGEGGRGGRALAHTLSPSLSHWWAGKRETTSAQHPQSTGRPGCLAGPGQEGEVGPVQRHPPPSWLPPLGALKVSVTRPPAPDAAIRISTSSYLHPPLPPRPLLQGAEEPTGPTNRRRIRLEFPSPHPLAFPLPRRFHPKSRPGDIDSSLRDCVWPPSLQISKSSEPVGLHTSFRTHVSTGLGSPITGYRARGYLQRYSHPRDLSNLTIATTPAFDVVDAEKGFFAKATNPPNTHHHLQAVPGLYPAAQEQAASLSSFAASCPVLPAFSDNETSQISRGRCRLQ